MEMGCSKAIIFVIIIVIFIITAIIIFESFS